MSFSKFSRAKQYSGEDWDGKGAMLGSFRQKNVGVGGLKRRFLKRQRGSDLVSVAWFSRKTGMRAGMGGRKMIGVEKVLQSVASDAWGGAEDDEGVTNGFVLQFVMLTGFRVRGSVRIRNGRGYGWVGERRA